MKLLFSAQPADGNGNQPAEPANPEPLKAPPESAEVVADSKTERELALEQQNKKLTQAVEKTAAAKRKVEIKNAELQDENHRLKQIPTTQPQPAKKKSQWLFFKE